MGPLLACLILIIFTLFVLFVTAHCRYLDERDAHADTRAWGDRLFDELQEALHR